MVVDFGGEGAKYNLSHQMQPTKELGPTSGRYTFDVHAINWIFVRRRHK